MCKACKHKHEDVNDNGYCFSCAEEIYWLMKDAEIEFGGVIK